MSAIVSSAITKSSSSMNSCPTRSSASCWFGVTRYGSASTPRRSGSPSQSSTHLIPRRVRSWISIGVEVVLDVARQRTAEDDVARHPRQVVELVREHLQLLRPHGRPPLVDLGERARRRIDNGDRGARLVGDADEVAEDSLQAEVLDDAVAVTPAREPAGDDRRLEMLQRARDVDALAARAGEALARAVPVTELEVRDGQGPVDRGVEGYGDDHCRCSTPGRKVTEP